MIIGRLGAERRIRRVPCLLWALEVRLRMLRLGEAVPSSLVFPFGLQEVPFSVKYLYSVILRCLVFLFLIKVSELRFFSLYHC